MHEKHIIKSSTASSSSYNRAPRHLWQAPLYFFKWRTPLYFWKWCSRIFFPWICYDLFMTPFSCAMTDSFFMCHDWFISHVPWLILFLPGGGSSGSRARCNNQPHRYVTWLVYLRHDSSICDPLYKTWLHPMCHDLAIVRSPLQHSRAMQSPTSPVRHMTHLFAKWLIYMWPFTWDMTHSYEKKKLHFFHFPYFQFIHSLNPKP